MTPQYKDKTDSSYSERAARITKVARKLGYKRDTVDAVIRDDRRNEKIMTEYLTLLHIEQGWEENRLLEAVLELVPFD